MSNIKLQRSRPQWAGLCPKTLIEVGSNAAISCALIDAKRDIEALHREVDRLTKNARGEA